MQERSRTKALTTVPWMLVDLTNDIHTVLLLHKWGNVDRYKASNDAIRRVAEIAARWADEVSDLVPQVPSN